MKKGILAISLVFLMMMQSLFHLGLIAYYNLNQTEIENLYCVNKNKPDMCCKGKCYIGKQLEKSGQQIPSKDNQEERDIPLFLVSGYEILTNFSNTDFFIKATLKTGLNDGYLRAVHHPPGQLV